MMMREVGVAEWWDIASKRDPAVVTMILSGNQMVGHVILAKCMVWY